MLIGLILTGIILTLQVRNIPGLSALVERFEWIVYDLRMNAYLPEKPAISPDIVIVDIDDKSLFKEGHWPWPRDKLARLVNNLFEKGAAVVAFDIVFAESETNAADTAIEIIKEIYPDESDLSIDKFEDVRASHDNDKIFSESLKNKDVVLGYILRGNNPQISGPLPESIKLKSPVSENALSLIMSSHVSNIETIQKAAPNNGFLTVFPDIDGTIRRYPLVLRYQDKLFPSLALEVARTYYVLDALEIKTSYIGKQETIEKIVVGDYEILTDGAGRVNIPYIASENAFNYVSATDILHNTVDKNKIENHIVLIGTTAEGLYDLRSSPVASIFPGIEIQATTISAILNRTFPFKPSWVEGADFIILLVLGVVLAVVLPLMSPLVLISFILSFVTGLVILNFWLWSSFNLVLSLSSYLILITLLGVFNLGRGFLREAFSRHQLKSMFGQYVPPMLVEEMSSEPENYSFEGESREMTVLFADIRNFTAISEAMPANQLKQMLNDFFTPMTRIIFNNRGTIDKYVGDMIMAFWGAPLRDDQHALHAVTTAMEMLEEVEILKPIFRQAGYPELDIGIGINSGVMNVGDMGSQYRRSYTVIGDSVNLASRLEGLTRQYGVDLIVNETTRKGMEEYLFQRLDRVQVRGKTESVDIYQPVCRKDSANETLLTELSRYEEALHAYLQQDWVQTEQLFNSLLQMDSAHSTLYQIYIDRIHELKMRALPTDWDGVYERRKK